MFNLVYPDDCRVCGERLRQISRIPVCASCLSAPKPLIAECFCVQCQTPFLNSAPLDEEGRCPLCRLGMSGFDRAWSWGEYEGPLRQLIHLYKYKGLFPLAKPLGVMMARALPRGEPLDVIVPMPLHWQRRWHRGFNQSELLARVIGQRTGLPVANAVGRRKSTTPQAGLTSAKRRLNVAGAFDVRKKHLVAGRSVLLVDDVFTTGATAGACAAALRRAGAERVSVLTLARVDRRKGSAGRSIA